ncbi:MAG: hypothetical protein JWR26_1355 [Pedosphaera sp.]|nr:hypothetical protein [Pedosphaera sp.]
MNEPENKFTADASAKVEELQNDLQWLRTLVSIALILLGLFGLSVDVFLLRQASLVRTQVTQTEMAEDNFNAAIPTKFWNRLNEYARTHPDFTPILAKYTPLVGQTLINNGSTAKSK